jgi:putative ABC transport system permease protein
MFLKIAILSLTRHKKRSVLIIGAIALAVFTMELMGAMFDGMRINFFKSLTRNSGHLIIYPQGYKAQSNPLGLEKRIERYQTVITDCMQDERVLSAEGFLHIAGLLISVPEDLERDSRDLMVELIGVGENSAFYSQVRDGLVSGAYLPRENSILISQRIAELLQITQGSLVSVLVEGAAGEAYYLDFSVDGMYHTSSDRFDETTVFINLKRAQELVGLENSVTEIRLLCRNKDEADVVKQDFVLNHPKSNLELETWKEMNGGFASVMDMVDVVLLFMNLVILLVGGSLIANAILMNVFDRMREYGTLRAIGLKRKQLRQLLLVEGVVEGVIGTFLGMIFSLPLVYYLSIHPLDGLKEVADVLMGSSFTFVITPQNILLNCVSGVLLALLASVYAATVAGKKSVYQALTYI